jgi:uncharacterized RDD family membrane protein YckC
MTDAYVHANAFANRDALTGVRTRRLMALCLDFVAVSVIATLLYLLLLVFTLGLSFFFLPPLWPIVAFFYSGVSMSSSRMATPGMRAMGLEVRMRDTGAPVPFLNAAAHGAFFYLSWFFPLVFLVTLVDNEKRFLHDIVSGVIVLRRL